jgi:hypothetical protein
VAMLLIICGIAVGMSDSIKRLWAAKAQGRV